MEKKERKKNVCLPAVEKTDFYNFSNVYKEIINIKKRKEKSC